MNIRSRHLGLVALVALFLFSTQVFAAPQIGTRQAGPPKASWTKRSGNPALEVPPSKRGLPAIARPKPLALTPEQKAVLPPPDWIVVHRPRTGETWYEPPSSLNNYLRGIPVTNAQPSSAGLLGKAPAGPALMDIIGTDQRQRVTPTTDFPWRVVGKTYMQFPNNSYWVASGALVDPFHVLTAGHVVHSKSEGGWATEIEFVPGMDGNYAPFSSAWDVDVRAPSGWVNSQDENYDWALITLDRNVGEWIGWMGYAYEQPDYYPNRVLTLAGYPDDLDQGLGLYYASDVATHATDYLLFYLIDSSAGQSGGPVWRYIQATDEHQIMAVHAYGNKTENQGTRINASVFSDIQNAGATDPPPTDWADLIDDGVSFAGFSPGTVSSGAPFEVHCDVRNIGTATATNFDVTFYASPDDNITTSDLPIGMVHVATLDPFTYVTCSWTGAFPATIAPGSYSVGWVIDSGNVVAEISEINNTAFLTTQLIVGIPPNLRFLWGDFAPASPIQLTPGDPLTLIAHLQNTGGSPAGPFWLEFWGSRNGGLTVSQFVANSARPSGIDAGVTLPFSTVVPLSSIPDGPYTIVMTADRPNEVAESDESDNRVVVGGKRLLVIRPQTNADIAVESFSFGPNPVYSGQAITLGGWVRNIGTEDSGPFWIEFWGSRDRLYPSLDFMLCDSIAVNNLGPGEAIDLSTINRTLYGTPSGIYMVGVVADRLDQISERDETNNHQFLDGYRLNRAYTVAGDPAQADLSELPDLVVTSADFAPTSPYQALPRSPLTLWARVENHSNQVAGPFWVEFFGSRTGGLSLDEFLADSIPVAGLGAWGAIDIAVTRPLYSIPDGPYTVVVTADRPGQVAESNEANNRFAVAGKRLLTIRPQTQANLVVEGFSVGPSPLYRGQPLNFTGRVANIGTESSGPFWIEFYITRTPNAPELDQFLCDSILVSDLGPAQAVELSEYHMPVYNHARLGSVGVICIADRTDLVNETHEEDNYVVLSGYQISP